ncbi:hypothetical protein AB4Z17_25965 [Paenibacillus sp. TAF43_2]|uniref:hypothetical protein n=1 Tax=Paenibacillus sp. TAF43_2 TaxID=3233069 RepID=UPI003F95CD58
MGIIIWIQKKTAKKSTKTIRTMSLVFIGLFVASMVGCVADITKNYEPNNKAVTSNIKEVPKADIKKEAVNIDYAQLKKNPDGHKGEMVKFNGEIIQIMETGNNTVIRLAVTKTDLGYEIDDIVWIEYDGLTKFVDKDIITAYGKITGTHSYKSQAGWKIQLPAMDAQIIE